MPLRGSQSSLSVFGVYGVRMSFGVQDVMMIDVMDLCTSVHI